MTLPRLTHFLNQNFLNFLQEARTLVVQGLVSSTVICTIGAAYLHTSLAMQFHQVIFLSFKNFAVCDGVNMHYLIDGVNST